MSSIYRIVTMITVLWPYQLQAQDANAVFRSVVHRYEQGMHAAFVYTMSSDVWDQDLVYSGHILLLGDQYRIESDEELIIGRGPDVWIYRAADGQILVSRALEDELTFAPDRLFANYEQYYGADALWTDMSGSVPHFVLELTPLRDESPLRTISLWVRQSDGIITLIEAADHSNTRMTIQLSDVELGPKVAADAFIMATPEGVEVIDLR